MKSPKNTLFGKLHFLAVCIAILVAAATSSCQQQSESTTTPPAVVQQPAPGYNPYKDAELTVDVFKVDSIETSGSRGWGYDIIMNGEPIFHQPHIPAVMGNNGFSSEEKAQTTGEFVIQKIKNNILPPTVTPEELDSLGVLD